MRTYVLPAAGTTDSTWHARYFWACLHRPRYGRPYAAETVRPQVERLNQVRFDLAGQLAELALVALRRRRAKSVTF